MHTCTSRFTTSSVICGRGSVNNTLRHVLPVLWMTSCFDIIDEMGDGAYVSSSSPGGGTGGEVCRLRLRLIMIARYNRISACRSPSSHNLTISLS